MRSIKYLLVSAGMFLAFSVSDAEEVDEKHAFEETIVKDNGSIKQLRLELLEKCQEVNSLFADGKEADTEAFNRLKEEIKEIRKQIFELEANVRQQYVDGSSHLVDESYAFWDQGETTLSQLIMEYGSSDYLYVIPPELSSMKISLFSSIPIPRSSWTEMIEVILNNNGIGVRKVNALVRQLYIIKQDLSGIEVIASDIKDIEYLPDSSQIFFVFSPSLEQVKAAQSFFERYSDIKQTNVQIVGNKVIIVSSKKNIVRLLQLHNAIWGTDTDKVVKVVKLSKMNAVEVEKVLKSFFGDQSAKSKTPFFQSKLDEVVTLPLPDNASIVLVGDKQMVQLTERTINDLESQLDDPGEMTIFWYTCKHSDPQEIAEVLNKIYASISSATIEGEGPKKNKQPTTEINQDVSFKTENANVPNIYNANNPIKPILEPSGKKQADKTKDKGATSNNFVVDDKTGSILMSVRKDELAKIQNILKKLDVPKRMAQIDVLLVERVLSDRKQTGINILKFGTPGIVNHQNSVSFDTTASATNSGVLGFIFSKPKTSFPSFDISLSFLMAQEDMKINANPTILAVNQTTAMISIVEEISLNNGAVISTTSSGDTKTDTFTRTQYGTVVEITPTIHMPDIDNPDDKGFVTLQTKVGFDSPNATSTKNKDKPPYTRRKIENEVRVADGETIIIGGLKKKKQEDVREKIPFLGDIPGIGKLFGTTKQAEYATEMFIFLTPRIIKDPIDDLRVERQRYLSIRPGDIPEFLEKVEQARACERKRLFANSMKVLFEK